MKICSMCKLEKSLEEFYPRKNRPGGLGVESRCKDCSKKRNNNKLMANQRQTIEGSMTLSAKRIKLDVEEVLEYYRSHDGLCDICRRSGSDNRFGRLFIDHDHETGEFRGLICNKCNLGLEKFDDNILLLESAINYLSRGGVT